MRDKVTTRHSAFTVISINGVAKLVLVLAASGYHPKWLDGLLIEEATQPFLDLQLDDTLDQFGAASLQYRVILGPNAGSRVLTVCPLCNGKLR